MEKKIAHLEMIEAVVERMSTNSFSLRGWSVTLVAALLALSTAVADRIGVLSVSVIPLLMFWILDGYYLDQERRFRELFDRVRAKCEAQIDFSMAVVETDGKWLRTLFSKTIFIFYGVLLLALIATIVFLSRR